jgi:hypothetical protein
LLRTVRIRHSYTVFIYLIELTGVTMT